MARQSLFLSIPVLVLALPAPAQDSDPAARDPQAMMAAVEAAQADASRPGDAELDCEAMEAEFTAIVNDPAFRAHIQASGASAQRDMAAMEAGRAQIPAKTAATVAAATVPGAAMATMSAEAAEGQVKQVQAAQRVQMRAAQGQQFMAFMPQMMRGQRLLELGNARDCEFAADMEGGLVPGAASPDEETDR